MMSLISGIRLYERVRFGPPLRPAVSDYRLGSRYPHNASGKYYSLAQSYAKADCVSVEMNCVCCFARLFRCGVDRLPLFYYFLQPGRYYEICC
jgi:hypothetical protein